MSKSEEGNDYTGQPLYTKFDPKFEEQGGQGEENERVRTQALEKLLWRYSNQQSPSNVLVRLEDRLWRDAWDTALTGTAGRRVIINGSELGVFAVRAQQHGAQRVLCVEPFPLDARISAGIIEKHFLRKWHAHHGRTVQEWDDEQRRESFASFATGIDVVDTRQGADPNEEYDLFVFPRIDHTLLGTGIVNTLWAREAELGYSITEILPRGARVFAQAIQWHYPAMEFDLADVNDLRWSLYPQPLELDSDFWTGLTEPHEVGRVAFGSFAETDWVLDLPTLANGQAHAIIFWFELDLGACQMTNEPGSDLHCLKPAVQYIDPVDLRAGDSLGVRVLVRKTRLVFQTRPPRSRERSYGVPESYIPSVTDPVRNQAYRGAIADTVGAMHPEQAVDLSAGFGVLSMIAAQAGVPRLVGLEPRSGLCNTANDIIARNGLGQRVSIVNRACANASIPGELDRHADIAVFDMFDCSLIGRGILNCLETAREYLLSSRATYIPSSAVIRAMVVEYRINEILGVDANLLNPYRASVSYTQIDADKIDYRPLTEPFDLFTFDFSTAAPEPSETVLDVPIESPGIAGAIIFWFDLQVGQARSISNAPGAETHGHWGQGLQYIPEIKSDNLTHFPLRVSHDGTTLQFAWQQDRIPSDAISQIPRLDPQWLRASNELEEQMQSLLQHCGQNLEEFHRVAEIAKGFSLDPAAHDLDPIIAQRFVSMFFSQ